MRVLMLTQIFDPEPTMKGLPFVQGLANLGHEIEVAAPVPSYPGGKIYAGYKLRLAQQETIGDVTVHRLPIFPSHDRSLIRRGLTYGSYLAAALVYGLLNARRFDVTYVYGPTVSVGLAAALSSWVTKRPFVLDIQDLWPDSALASGMMKPGLLYRILGSLCGFVYRRSAAIILQSAGMKQQLADRGVPTSKLATIYNWADNSSVTPRGCHDLSQYEFPGHFTFVYGGNLGPAQALDTAIRAAVIAAKTSPSIRLLLIGEGVEQSNLQRLIDDLGASNVKIFPRISRDYIADVLASADVLLVSLANQRLFDVTVPSKTQFYLAVGKPILISSRGEAASLIEHGRAGVAVPPENPDAMAAAMISLSQQTHARLQEMARSGRRLYAERFSLDVALAQTHNVLLAAIPQE